MSEVLRLRWQTDFMSGLPRRDRRSCEYEAYLPDQLGGRALRLDGDVAADVADAERAIARFDTKAVALADTEALARLLLRTEAVASSKIEGLEVGGRRLLRAAVARAVGDEPTDVTAVQVLGNIEAMSWALHTVGESDEITLATLLEAHRLLLLGTRLEEHGGRIRAQQNWIGGSDHNPCSADFVPPPPESVEELLEDLCAFCNTDDLPVVVQAALAHAQFETIHPFIDGNGRIGRALIHLVLRRRGLTLRVVPPVSLVLATWSKEYISALNGTRYVGPSTSAAAMEGTNRWIAVFATACRRAIADAETFEEHVTDLQEAWRSRLGSIRSGSATELLIRALPGAPVMTVNAAADLIHRKFDATNQAISRLAAAGILKQTKVGRRNRAFEAPELLRKFTDLERMLASPTGDTRASEPARRVPRRPS